MADSHHLKMTHNRPPNWIGSSNFQKSKMKNGKSAIEQYLIMRRMLVCVKSAIHRVGNSRIICYVIYFTYFT